MSFELDFAAFNPKLFGQSKDDDEEPQESSNHAQSHISRNSVTADNSVDVPEDDDDEDIGEAEVVTEGDSDDDDYQSEYTKQTSPSNLGRGRKQNLKVLREDFEEDPELYGIRRSGRSRKEPTRLNIKEIEPKKKNRRQRMSFSDSSRSRSSSESSSDYRPKRNRHSYKNGKVRTVRTRGNRVSYKEASSGSNGSYSDDDSGSRRARKRNRRSGGGGGGIMSQRPSNKQHPLLAGRANNSAEYTSREPLQKPRGSLVRCSISNLKSRTKRLSVSENSDLSRSEEEEELKVIKQKELEYFDSEEVNVIEEVVTHKMGTKGTTGDKSTFYNLNKSKDDSQEVTSVENEDLELQFLIKWKGWSHIHNTWENGESLTTRTDIGGIKKLQIYKDILKDREAYRKYASVEELEAAAYEEERNEQILMDKRSVERIVTHFRTKQSISNDYLIKWKLLDYCYCTWEDGKIVHKFFPEAVEEYETRCRSTKTPNKKCDALRVRPKFIPQRQQPDYIGGGDPNLKLRDYQLDGVNWLSRAWSRGNSVILADEMGLGKTIQTIGFLSHLFHDHKVYGPFLLVVPLSTVGSWQSEFAIWAKDMNVILYTGNAASRQTIREYEWYFPGKRMLKLNVCITTYEILLKDKAWLGQVSWASLGVDEAHRLKNEMSQLYKALIGFDTNTRLLITGTPLQNSLRELWALLYFIMPHKFGEWSYFEEMYSVDSEGTKVAFNSLHKSLEPFLLRRVKKDVEKSLPAKSEQILRVEMATVQETYYKWILAKNYEMLSKEMNGHVTSFVNIVMELKKCCNHPHLVTRPGEENDIGVSREDQLRLLVKSSGKMMLLDKLLFRLKEKGHRVLIFSQMVRMLDIIADYLILRGWAFQRLDGSIRGDLRKQALDHFNTEGSTDFCFLLSTRAGGLGVNLATADVVIIFDSDWNPQNDLQAQARAHRIGQTKQVSVYRLVTKNSVEEKIIEKAKKKMVLDHLVIQRMDTTGRNALTKTLGGTSSAKSQPFNKEELTEILRFGTQELFKEKSDGPKDEVDIDEILNRAEMRDTEAEAENQNPASDLLSQFKVVTLENLEDEEIVYMDSRQKGKTWSQIIPEGLRNKVKEDENEKTLVKLELGPRQRKQVCHFKAGVDENDSDDESSSSSEDEKRKAGRMTEKESRAVIRTMKRFANPQERVESIIAEAEIPERTEKEVKDLILEIINGCQKVVETAEYQGTTAEENSSVDEKSSSKNAVFQLGRIAIPAKSFLQSINYLSVLHTVMPSDHDSRLLYELPFQTKLVNWTCEWDCAEDARLLVGVYEHGMDSWEAIKMDPDLGLTSKILPTASSDRPHSSHLRTRVDYLLKLLRKGVETTKDVKVIFNSSTHSKSTDKVKRENVPRPSKRKNTVPEPSIGSKLKSKEFIDSDDTSDSSDDSDMGLGKSVGKISKSKDKKSAKKRDPVKKDSNGGTTTGEHGEPKKKVAKLANENKVKKRKKVQDSGPVHIRANHQPVSVNKAEEENFNNMAGPIFDECKVKMRSIRKHIKKLEEADTEDCPKLREYLLKIGDHINKIIHEYTDKTEVRRWRNYLWYFVNFFTQLTDKQLHKIYKDAYKERSDAHGGPPDDQDSLSLSSPKHNSKHHHSSHHSHHPHHHKDDSSSTNTKSTAPVSDNSRHHHSHHHDHRSSDYSSRAGDHHSKDHHGDSHYRGNDTSRQTTGGGYAQYHRDSRDHDGPSCSRFDNAYNRRPNRPYQSGSGNSWQQRSSGGYDNSGGGGGYRNDYSSNRRYSGSHSSPPSHDYRDYSSHSNKPGAWSGGVGSGTSPTAGNFTSPSGDSFNKSSRDPRLSGHFSSLQQPQTNASYSSLSPS